MIGRLVALGAVLMFAAVAAGAFGAHALRERLDDYARGVYDKATFYHFIHALGILLIATLGASKAIEDSVALKSAVFMAAGILIFSGTLYLLALTGMRWLGAITPVGGTLFLIAWAYLAWSAWSAR